MSARNRLVTQISNTPGLSGGFSIAAALPSYRTFSAADDGEPFDVSIVDGIHWEIRTGCIYTHSGTSLSRGILEESSSGSAIDFSNRCVLSVTLTASIVTELLSIPATVALKANIDSPEFTGTPLAPTPSTIDNSTQLATTAFVSAKITDVTNVLDLDGGGY